MQHNSQIIGWRWTFALSSSSAALVFFIRRSVNIDNTVHQRGGIAVFMRNMRQGDHLWMRLFLSWMLGVFKAGAYWAGFVRRLHMLLCRKYL